MRVTLLSYYFPEYCLRLANELANQGPVQLMLPIDEESESLVGQIDPRVEFEPFHQPRNRQPLRQLKTNRQILRRLRAFGPDVLHYQHGHLYFNLALPLLRRFPLTLTIHDVEQHPGDRESRLTPQAVMDFGYRRADQVIVHSRAGRTRACERFRLDPSRVHYIPHTAIGERADQSGAADDGATVLSFGRIWEYKGLDYLIRAQPKVTAALPGARFVIAGQGEDFGRYRRMMHSPDRFVVHNDWIDDATRDRLFASASVVALPYTEASQSGVIPIAYTHEKPVVATRVGGLPDMVEHGATGLLVPPRDADALADALIRLLSDPAERRRMGAAGREKLDRECAPHVVAEQTLRVYRRALDGRNRGEPVAPRERSSASGAPGRPA